MYIVVVVTCASIQLVDGTGSINNDENTYLSEVNVTCSDGYKIAGKSKLTVNCTADGTWSVEPVLCERQSLFYLTRPVFSRLIFVSHFRHSFSASYSV